MTGKRLYLTSEILVPNIARTVMRPKHIVVVFFTVPVSKLFPDTLGRYSAF